MGAAERRRWSSLLRQELVGAVADQLSNPGLHGVAVLGPRGVGKTTLARSVETQLAATTHVVRAFGSSTETEIPYGIFSVYMARLSAHQTETPTAVLNGLVDLIAHDAQGKPIVVVLDGLPGIDTLSMGVLMHLVLGGLAKLLVMARRTIDLPEDLVWMAKDGMLAQQRLGEFTRAEVRTLLIKALDGPVAESVVAALYTSSAGNPLVLQALVNEYLRSSMLRTHDGVWILYGRPEKFSDDILVELVNSRLSREPASVRRDVAKISLLRAVPFKMAVQALGAKSVADLEVRGILSISAGQHNMVSFVEPYFGETVRSQLSPAEKANYFQEVSEVLDLDPSTMGTPELLTFAAWINDAGMVMQPEVAIAAARAAVHYFDPQLVFLCCDHISPNHPLTVQAMQLRSRAHYLLANYAKATEVLESLDAGVVAALGPEEYASWATDLARSLLWSPGGLTRIEKVLADTAERIQAGGRNGLELGSDSGNDSAQKILNLTRFEYQIHRGEFTAVLPLLELGSKDSDDDDYRLNCACLLTMALAATGRQVDAVELAHSIDGDVVERGGLLRMGDWHFHGRLLALAWSGRWLLCKEILEQTIEYSNGVVQYRGGLMELALGTAYAYAQRLDQAADVLLTAAAQLEIRDSYSSLELVYSVLAYCYAQRGAAELAGKYQAMAHDAAASTTWVNRSVAQYFQLLALHSLDDPRASPGLVDLAEIDVSQGRFSTASMNIFGAIATGSSEQYRYLAEISGSCQGPLAAVNTLLGRARESNSAALALEAADGARSLDLGAVEAHCVELAVQIAKAAGESRVLREAQQRLHALAPAKAQTIRNIVVPLTSRELQVARLAIRGLSNREIATKIGVSVRTVEGHLYQVFAKLGITSRQQLDGWTDL